MRARRFAFAFLCAFLPSAAGAVLPSERLADPALEARARVISQDLRCQVCQNQSIDDSNASLAADLRRLVRERLTAGDSNEAVLSYVTQRYGDYVLLRPPLRTDTILLWYGPFGLLAAGLLGAAIYIRRRNPKAAPSVASLSAEEEQRLAKLLAPEERK
ncbi:MAG: cytochrome c-type biogenesis protein CcmH [Magnetospirillum sp.]|nr:cytochrome c-type biogenesis protein CcmH [Magnetospirillum sp.]